MVVAHPDDETLWGGATLAREPGWGVICLTHSRTRHRRRAFEEAMRRLEAVPVLFDVPDRRTGEVTAEDRDLMSGILDPILTRHGIEFILTHSPDGETGHRIHMAISDVVSRIADPSALHYFSFDPALDLARDEPDVWERKAHALRAYFDPLESAAGNDGLHIRLSRHERPVLAADYRRPNELILSVYRGSTVPAGSIEKGIAE
jgi:LmbE family N-acetylglucosaminyl deacetylase